MAASHLAMLQSLNNLYRGEAIFRPSSISRLLKCPGSVQLIARSPADRGSSKYALEGTAAHAVAQSAMLSERQPDEWTDRGIIINKAGDTHLVDAEMADCVQFYIDEVAKRWTPTTEQHVEKALSLAPLDPTDPILAHNRGTGDGVLVDRKAGKLTIADLKYGKGVMVAGDAPQLKNYALMGLVTFKDVQWEVIETLVVQPRAINPNERVKSVLHTPFDLLSDFVGELVGAMYRSLEADPPLKTGSHCRWCRAAANCPAVAAEAQSIGHGFDQPVVRKSIMGAIPKLIVASAANPAPVPAVDTVVLPLVDTLSASDVATILDREDVYDTWISAIKKRAVTLFNQGQTVPGYAMVQRTGNRRWKLPVNTTVDALRRLGVAMSDMFTEPDLLSPAKMEKLIKDKDRRDDMADLIERPLGDPTLVKNKDGDKKTMQTSSIMGAISVD